MRDFHIGELIKEQVDLKGITVTEFAKRITKSRENIYSIFTRKTIDTGLLLKISEVLEYDFFELFVKDKSKEKIQKLEEEINLLKEYNQLLKANQLK